MADARITCVNKAPHQNPHEGISHLGGAGWRWTREQVIASIEQGTNTFYTYADGHRADLQIVSGPTGKYLRTTRDGQPTDNLLALPDCQV
jgi:hypothetical protein